jgi:hypothetical protein
MAKAITATRARPPPPEAPQKLTERLKAEASNAALNAVSIAKDVVEDFRRSDRYFKYKAGILASWVVLTLLTLVASCPHRSELDAKNRLGARLGPPSTDPDHPAITIYNEGDDPWEDVTVIVNRHFRAAVGHVQGHGNDIIITPKQLTGDDNQPVPSNLKATDVEIRTSDGKARLMKDGQEQ